MLANYRTLIVMMFYIFNFYVCYIFIAVCLCLCVCDSVCVSVGEQNSSGTDALIWTLFLLNGCLYCTGSDPIEIGDLWSKDKVTVTLYLFFFVNQNSFFTSLLAVELSSTRDVVTGLRLTTHQLANGEYVHASGEWRLLICSPVWRVIFFNFFHWNTTNQCG